MRQATQRSAIAIFACAFAVSWLFALRANAQKPDAVALEWQAEPPCPDRAWAEARLRDRLGRELATQAATAFTARAELRRTEAGFQLSLTTAYGTERGERRLQGKRCEEVAEAAVLVIALAVEEQQAATPAPLRPPSSEVAPEADPSTPAPAAEPVPPPAPPAPATPAAKRDAERPPAAPADKRAQTLASRSFALRAALLLEVGFLPAVGVGPQGSVAYSYDWLQAELAGFWLPERSQSSDQGGVSVSLWALRPTACARLWEVRFRIDACTGFELGSARGRGTDLNAQRERSWFYRAAWAALRLSTPTYHSLALVLEPGLGIPLGRPSFVSVSPGQGAKTTLHTPALVSGRVTLGVELRF